MFRENTNAIRRMTEESVVYLAVACIKVNHQNLSSINAIVACCEEPIGQSDFSILSCFRSTARLREIGPSLNENETDSNLMSSEKIKKGEILSSLRTYATMLTVMGVTVYVTKKSDKVSRTKGGSLVVTNPGIGGKAIYESSYDKAKYDSVFDFFEFNPEDPEQFYTSIPILSCRDLVNHFESVVYDVDLSNIFDYENADSIFWGKMLGYSDERQTANNHIINKTKQDREAIISMVQQGIMSRKSGLEALGVEFGSKDEMKLRNEMRNDIW